MIDSNQVQGLVSGGGDVLDSNGDKIGSIGQVFLDDRTGRPEWVTVNTGLFGGGESFVPLRDGTISGNDVRVSYTKDKVKDAPRISDSDGHLDEADEDRLYAYYGTDGADYDTSESYYGGTSETSDGVVGHDTSGPTTDNAMTRSEEHLDVGTTREEAGRARLRKYVTTEQETVTVPVRKERAVIETEPITDANRAAATAGPAISEEEHEVVLEEERAVVSKTAEPVERVRLDTETVTDEETVTEEVRKEHIEAEGDVHDRRDGV